MSLPTGGGAIRSIGEKFTTNLTGTGTMTVPLGLSPGRSGFGPQLALSCDTGAGNGPFGFGWRLPLASITRKTDKGVPRYVDDGAEADVYVLAGAEDLVPLLVERGGEWEEPQLPPATLSDGSTWRVRRYRPRTEGLFSRIERWTNVQPGAAGSVRAGETHWRSISRDNVTTVYGLSAESRIADPADPLRVFSWLICESYDDKGNAILYGYKPEDSTDVDVAQAHERNRSDDSRSTNRHIKRILYGNRTPRRAAENLLLRDDWLFEAVFDYGEHDPERPAPDDSGGWLCRHDPFSTYRAGFELRTYRLCQRVLMFHHFPDEPVGRDCLVRSSDIAYRSNRGRPEDVQRGHPVASFVASITQTGYQLTSGGAYLNRSLPPLQFDYSEAVIRDELRSVEPDAAENLPEGVDGRRYQWADLDGEGVQGVLSQHGTAWYYKRNVSPARDGVSFAPLELVSRAPASAALETPQQLLDLAGDGTLDFVAFGGELPGFYERADDDAWDPFTAFAARPNLAWDDPNLRLVDLTGDGRADVLITENDALTWYPSRGEQGFGAAERVAKGLDDESGPRLVFADGGQSVFLADMSGDGLSDLVRIRNGEIAYWPNLGYARFGGKVTMDDAPYFDHPDQFSASRVRLADVDGSGPADIVYLGREDVSVHLNRAGNGWSDPQHIRHRAPAPDATVVDVVDLLGNGTACLVWSSALPGDVRRPLQYVDLMGGRKPHLLVRVSNNLGGETSIRYAASTRFAAADNAAGRPWRTRLPFPVHVVAAVTIKDRWRASAFTSTFSYHHGRFDGVEREFHGFGRVEQVDVESYGTFASEHAASPFVTDDERLFQPPVKTVTWLHTGSAGDHRAGAHLAESEHFPAWLSELPVPASIDAVFTEKPLPEPELAAVDLTTDEWRQALRACKGTTLRQEVCELDPAALEGTGRHVPTRLLSVTTRNVGLRRLQPARAGPHAVFLVTESEAVTYQHDLDLRGADRVLRPDPRISHTLNLRHDDVGNVEQSVTVGYARVRAHAEAGLDSAQLGRIRAVQAEQHVTYTETHYTDDVVAADDPRLDTPGPWQRLRQAWEVLTYELTGVPPAHDRYFAPADFHSLRLSDTLPGQGPEAVGELPYHRPAVSSTGPEKRKVQHVVTRFFAKDLSTPLAPGRLSPRGLVYETYRLALTRALLADVLGTRFDADAEAALDAPAVSGYRPGTAVIGAAGAGQWWIASGVAGFGSQAAGRFYLPEAYRDPFGNTTAVAYDTRYRLFVQSATDAAGNRTAVVATGSPPRPRFDYRVLAPVEVEDANGNRTEVVFDVLGMVVGVADKGKGAQADNLSGYSAAFANATASSNVAALLDLDGRTPEEARARLAPLLRNATRRYLYDFGEDGAAAWGRRPAVSCTIIRERHAASLRQGDPPSPLQISLEVSDGLGTVLMTRRQAEPGPGASVVRWAVTGKTVLNNKGRPVKQYEPYFSASATGVAGGALQAEAGVTPLMVYDAAGRLVRTDLPDGTLSRVEFSPWRHSTHDTSDTVRESAWYVERGAPDPDLPLDSNATAAERAAWLAARHADTPSVSYLDSLGREVVVIVHNRVRNAAGTWQDERYDTFTRLDAEGKPLWIRDARGNVGIRYTVARAPGADATVSFIPAYDIAGNLLYHHTADAGDRWTLLDAGGQTIRAWDRNEQEVGNAFVLQDRLHVFDFDALRRPVAEWLSIDGAPAVRLALTVYRDGRDNDPGARSANLQGRPVRRYDASGLTETVRCDLHGNVTEVHRRLNHAPTAAVVDWQGDLAGQLAAETFVRIIECDALSRVARLFNWHRGTGTRVAVYEPTYGARGLLASDRLIVRATKSAAGYTSTANTTTRRVTEQAAYDAGARPTRVQRGNGTVTRYEYDPRTFRPVQIRTTRPGADLPFPGTHAGLRDARVLQQLNYTYDPGGNVVEVYDEAYEPAFFQNQMVPPRDRYEYDALYRVTEAGGREDGAVLASTPHGDADSATVAFAVGPTDPRAMRRYRESFAYDPMGNVTRITHAAGAGSWTRYVEYASDNSRLVRSWNGDPDPGSTRAINEVTYRHDTHGNLRNVAAVAPARFLRWDPRDMLAAVDLLGGGWAHYQYDAAKHRTRKWLARIDGAVEERIDLGGYELYRRYRPGSQGVAVEEIESVHVQDGDRRVLLVDDVIRSPTFQQGTLLRYQYDDHVGSACLELDAQAAVISYEAYHPFGTSAHRLASAAVEAPPKRYRHMGRERDAESGLSYGEARFLVPWLCRWATPDPTGIADGLNLYRAFRSNPLVVGDRSGTQTDFLNIRLPERYYRLGGPLGVCRERVPGVPDLPRPPPRREDGPQMYANDPNAAMKRANSIFPPHQQEMLEQTIRGPVLAASAPAVAVTVGAAGIAGGSYHLATGDYDRAALAFSTSLEVLPGVAPEFAMTSNQRMALAIEQSQLALEREAVMASLAEQRAAHTIQTNTALAGAQARAAADEFATFAVEKVAPRVGAEAVSAAQASRELGPVATVVVDSRYPVIEVGLNIQRGRGLPPTAAELQQLRESLHPLLRSRLDALEAHLAELQRTGQITNEIQRAGVAGTHSEIIALNKAIKAREALTGVTVTEGDLTDFVFVNRNLQGPFCAQTVPPPCYNCSYLIRGTTAGQ